MDWLSILFGGGVGGILVALGILIHRIYKARGGYSIDTAEANKVTAQTDAEIQDRRDAVSIRELKQIIRLMQQERVEDRGRLSSQDNKISELSDHIRKCEIDNVRKDERIKALEDALDNANIPYKRVDGSSTTHRPLPQWGDTDDRV